MKCLSTDPSSNYSNFQINLSFIILLEAHSDPVHKSFQLSAVNYATTYDDNAINICQVIPQGYRVIALLGLPVVQIWLSQYFLSLKISQSSNYYENILTTEAATWIHFIGNFVKLKIVVLPESENLEKVLLETNDKNKSCTAFQAFIALFL